MRTEDGKRIVMARLGEGGKIGGAQHATDLVITRRR
jgi:hypothetical protein